jgi:hypothetical protein
MHKRPPMGEGGCRARKLPGRRGTLAGMSDAGMTEADPLELIHEVGKAPAPAKPSSSGKVPQAPQDRNKLKRKERDRKVADKYISRDGGPPKIDEKVERLADLSPADYEHEEVERLADLSPADYELARRGAASMPGWELEAWPEEVDGNDLLNQIASRVAEYLILPPGAAATIALWAVFTHAHDSFNISPLLVATSPTPECGKTTLLEVVSGLCPKPLNVSNVTAASLFRAIDRYAPTFILDEGDTYLKLNDNLRAVLNSGHKRSSAQVLRCNGPGLKWFSTWCPKAIGLIGSLPPTLASRAIHIELQRKLPSEVVKRFELEKVNPLSNLQRQAARWATDHRTKLADADPVMPPSIYGRMADNWRPLLAIADEAGGEWPERAREAAVLLSTAFSEKTAAIQLLEDIREILKARGLRPQDNIWSEELVQDLLNMEERSWSTRRRSGEPITQNEVASMLRGFKVVPKQIKRGANKRGYLTGSLYAAFERYLAPEGKP